jgi:hypothetical protein
MEKIRQKLEEVELSALGTWLQLWGLQVKRKPETSEGQLSRNVPVSPKPGAHAMANPIAALIVVIVLIWLGMPCAADAADIEGHIVTIYFVRGGAHVELYDERNHLKQTADVDEAGLYEFLNVPSGTYHLAITGQMLAPTMSLPFTVSAEPVNNLDYVIRPSTAALLAAARALARWNPDELITLVNQYREWFVQQNEIYPCASAVSSQLSSVAFSMASPQQNYESALKIATRSGVPGQFARQVANSLSANFGNISIMAQDIADLSTAIRGLTSGGSTQYRNTQLYQDTANQVIAYRQLITMMTQMYPQLSGLDAVLRVTTESIVFELTFPAVSAVCK